MLDLRGVFDVDSTNTKMPELEQVLAPNTVAVVQRSGEKPMLCRVNKAGKKRTEEPDSSEILPQASGRELNLCGYRDATL